MKVWIVFKGEDYEGGSVMSVHKTAKAAWKVCKADATEFSDLMSEFPDVKLELINRGFHVGCDYWVVKPFEVQE